MIDRCTDPALMYRIANSDGVREFVGIEVDGQQDWNALATTPPEQSGVFCITDGDDALGIASVTVPGVVQGHWLFGRSCRGKRAIATGKAMIAWLHDHGQAIVWGNTPRSNRKAIWFNRMLGGTVLPTSDDETVNFEWRAHV
jgi:hypothetical protein